MDLHLSGKVAVVTGASRGIGLAVVQALVEEGMSVASGARAVSPEIAQLAAGAPGVLGTLRSVYGTATCQERRDHPTPGAAP